MYESGPVGKLALKLYLLNVSYIGTPFRGVQRQVSVKECRLIDTSTVQGQIELCLQSLKPLNEPAAVLSSRTDKGVHAFHTTMHIDLHKFDGKPYEPAAITGCLNQYFAKSDIPIRIIKTYLVPSNFHCRHNAISRTYLYRLIVVNNHNKLLHGHLPIEEFNRCLFLSYVGFDIDKLKEAANLFVGYHDFRTFMHKERFQLGKKSRKIVEKCEIQEDIPRWSKSYAWPSCASSNETEYKAYNIVIKANGFVYKQVRRTVASLIAVAKGIVTPKDIKFMLEIPSRHSWDPRIKTVPPYGLYLCEVAYSQNDQDTFKERLED